MPAHRRTVPLALLAAFLLLTAALAGSPAAAATASGKLLWTYTQATFGTNDDTIIAAVPGPKGSMYAASTMNDDWSPGAADLGMYRFRSTMGAGGPVVWSAIWDNPLGNLADWTHHMTADAAGNAIAAGGTYTTAQGCDWLIIKRSPGGALLWTATLNGAGHDNDYLDDVACDGTGNVYACGMLSVGPGQSDWVVAKFRATDGQLLWSYTYKGPAMPQKNNRASALAVNHGGYAYVTGESENAAGWNDIVVMKLTPAGSVMWTDRIDGAAGGDDRGRGVALNSGAVYVSAAAAPSGGGSEVLLVRYDASGARRWTRTWHLLPGIRTSVDDLTVDGAGNPVVCGSANVAAGQWVACVVSWTPAGKLRWATTWWDKKLSVKSAGFWAVTADAAGNVWVAGAVDVTAGVSDALLVRFRPTGKVKWVRTLDGDAHGADYFTEVVLWGKSWLFVGGRWTTTSGGADALAARYTQ
jgi:hypothetical protein